MDKVKGKFATTIDRQIELLKERGMTFDKEWKAKENLLDIGYYRLGSHLKKLFLVLIKEITFSKTELYLKT